MSCNCVKTISKELDERNGKLDLTYTMNGGEFPTIMVSKKDKKNRTRPPVVVPTYCPFCGKEYREPDKSKDAVSWSDYER